ncbi:Isocitrate dehydrogenase [NAD] subunit 1, mitochondrial [Schizosaccharomyces pombe]|uniref:Isocitrate dehydrogenase [NAD] subunit 1, mitochondrial n=1 Tax=Schizosaccharomyces pombe (strain 972 / ATCC 24843) TaxID=284812 RepID=IDH1_SCHPO|nr:isocitrate dehydrogenase (NAD+) subunit 1 Idh1 [Schizosaccharomyces pombe]O13696.1 RecName: Full=Isocitrate dehydrogenase [NAD] subunit 1, mitochondrial; AltName: Full=Isocitric dehydrogenase; AltName: Full=NAD(+)-specific ICDH; Flags: Precursor [Schizosaccharomyces pombe 972h-]CAB16208.1 isocitrate dehydrogenase (NAD+) subunit 1 Idh1 [Schizosaccharomyces pombe]|eukprot:NP_594397.1 isocitrate dehydrogenase (NAD+) subunit 1 Idh1 [Schizosaccharomyces pombe]
MFKSLVRKSSAFQPLKYGGKYTVTLIPGDGIGRETSNAVTEIFKTANVPIEFEEIDVTGMEKNNKSSGDALHEAIQSLKRNKVGLKGILFTPFEKGGHTSFNVALRKELDIYASLVLIKNIPGFKTRHDNVDFAIIRENTEGEYSGLEHQSVPGVVESLKIITEYKSKRIAQFAFDFALQNGRKSVTCIHKANIMKLADGLFRRTFYDVANGYDAITPKDLIVDNASMQAVSRPQQFDVLVMPNLYGSILSNIGSALVGGPGVIPGANFGRDYALFEPGCRHVGLSITGRGEANPTAAILSACLMLRHLGLKDYADLINAATYSVIEEGKTLTKDLGGSASTGDFTHAILERMESL